MLLCVLGHSRPEDVMLTMCFLSQGLNPLLLVLYNEIFFLFLSTGNPFESLFYDFAFK